MLVGIDVAKGELVIAEPLKTKVSYGTAHMLYRFLRARLNDALRLKRIQANPINDVILHREKFRASEAVRGAFTAEQVRKFRAIVKRHRFGVLWVLAADAGLRPGEAEALKWVDVVWDHGALFINRSLTWMADTPLSWNGPSDDANKPRATWHWTLTPTKTGEERTVRLAPATVEMLKEHKAKQDAQREEVGPGWTDHGFLFTTHTGGPLMHNNIGNQWRAMLKQNADKLPRIRPYDLRATHGSVLNADGTGTKVIQDRLGHADFQTTANHYLHIDAEQDRAAAIRFTELTTEPPIPKIGRLIAKAAT